MSEEETPERVQQIACEVILVEWEKAKRFSGMKRTVVRVVRVQRKNCAEGGSGELEEGCRYSAVELMIWIVGTGTLEGLRRGRHSVGEHQEGEKRQIAH